MLPVNFVRYNPRRPRNLKDDRDRTQRLYEVHPLQYSVFRVCHLSLNLTGGIATCMTFLIDSVVYTSTVVLYLDREFFHICGDVFGFFRKVCYLFPVGGIIILMLKMILFINYSINNIF